MWWLAAAAAAMPSCRDRSYQPFSRASIWNTPIGSAAKMVPAGIFADAPPKNGFHNDQDWLAVPDGSDPPTEWVDQGDWGSDDKCVVRGTKRRYDIPFPRGLTTGGQTNNNAAAILLPDKRALVQMQPLYRCQAGGPVLARWGADRGCPQLFPNVTDVLGDGALGAHGGSGLSSIGGTIRVGELTSAEPIRHALKLELYSGHYYYGAAPLQNKTAANGGRTQYVWPATGSDSCSRELPGCYKGTDPLLAPGSLLAIPDAVYPLQLSTPPARKIAAALRTYGGYIVDDTANPSAAVCMESAVNDEMQRAFGYSMPYPAGIRNGPFFDDLVAVFRALHVVANNAEGSVGGGGAPLGPAPAPVCDNSGRFVRDSSTGDVWREVTAKHWLPSCSPLPPCLAACPNYTTLADAVLGATPTAGTFSCPAVGKGEWVKGTSADIFWMATERVRVANCSAGCRPCAAPTPVSAAYLSTVPVRSGAFSCSDAPPPNETVYVGLGGA